MISDDKMTHIVHLILDGLEREGYLAFIDRETATREARRTAIQFMSNLHAAGDAARKRILSQKNSPPEFSAQWDNLYRKYYEEELRKRGG